MKKICDMTKRLEKEQSHLPFFEIWVDDETGVYETIHRDYSKENFLHKSSKELYQYSLEMGYIDESTTFEEFIKKESE